jgi:hypothetical protein
MLPDKSQTPKIKKKRSEPIVLAGLDRFFWIRYLVFLGVLQLLSLYNSLNAKIADVHNNTRQWIFNGHAN